MFQQAGYAEPVIPASSCKNIDAGQTQLRGARYDRRPLPGRQATVTSTATAADAAQQVVIVAGDQSCRNTYKPDAATPWPVGSEAHLRQAVASSPS